MENRETVMSKVYLWIATTILVWFSQTGHAFVPSTLCIDYVKNNFDTLSGRTDSKGLTHEQWQQILKKSPSKTCPLGTKFLTYIYLLTPSNKDVKPLDIINFIEENPSWPERTKLIQRIEDTVKLDENDNRRLIAWFSKNPPTTGNAIWVYSRALDKAKKIKNLKIAVKNGWKKGCFDPKTEDLFYRNFKKYLSQEDHKKRINNLFLAKNHKAIQRSLKYLSSKNKVLSEARLFLQQKRTGVDNYVQKARMHFKNHFGFLYDQLVWHRERKNNDEAFNLLVTVKPEDPYHGQIWHERHILTRRALENKRYDRAYALASSHGLSSGANFATGEWLAGWIALRFLNKPSLALQHFSHLYDNVGTPISKSKAAYWMGRAFEVMNQPEKAKRAYEKATLYRSTFYSHLAAGKLGLDKRHNVFLKIKPESSEQKEIESKEFAKLLILLSYVPQTHVFKRPFALSLASMAENNKQQVATLIFLEKYAPHFRADSARIMNMKHEIFIKQAYPTYPKDKLNPDVESHLILSIMRRESGFDHQQTSPAGAQGLMQLMPATAKTVAKKHKIPYNHRKDNLLDKHELNALIASTYLKELLNKYDGAYPLAIAAYNAGDKPVDLWLKTFGNPAKGEVDWLDWLELIPYYETRDYVQRVLEYLHIYRLNFSNSSQTPPSPLGPTYATNYS